MAIIVVRFFVFRAQIFHKIRAQLMFLFRFAPLQKDYFQSSLQQSKLVCILQRMQINLISVGNRMPDWVQQGYNEYAKRLPRDCNLVLKEVAPGKRGKNSDASRIVKEEGERMIAAIPPKSHIVTLDIPGKSWTTNDLASTMQRWRENTQHVALMIGGPEGLSERVKEMTQESWSLSKLTFPHPLVRIVVAEQIYRAWSILNNHPYHR